MGRPVGDVEADLRGQGLSVTLDELDNDGTQEEGAVESVNPTGTLQEGDTVTVRYWGQAPAPEPTPTEEPEPTEEPSEEPSATPTETPTDGATG